MQISAYHGFGNREDEGAWVMGLNCLHVIVLEVRDFLQRHRREQMLRRLNEVYANGADPVEKRLLNRIKTKVRQTVKESW